VRRTVSIPYGEACFSLELEAELIEPAAAAPAAEQSAVIREALDRPIGAARLEEVVRPGESVAVIVNDITRPARSDLFLPPLVERLNRAGIADRDIFIVFALGTHRPHTPEEQRRIVGREIFRRIRLYDHDAAEEANLVTAGVTRAGNRVQINRRVWEADRIVLTGAIVEHRIAGYSGGRKSLAPGVAGESTIRFNHRLALDPRCRPGVLEGNPAHEDLLQACALAEPDFLFNVIVSPQGELLAAVAGHFDGAHREGCRLAERLLTTPVSGRFDVVIASAGGWPLDIDLRQAHKGMENAAKLLRPGGALFYYAACRDGLGSPHIEEYLRRYRSAAAMEAALRENFVVGGHKALWLAQLGESYRVHLVSELAPGQVRRCGFEALAPAEQEAGLGKLLAARPSARVAVMPYANLTVPRGAERS